MMTTVFRLVLLHLSGVCGGDCKVQFLQRIPCHSLAGKLNIKLCSSSVRPRASNRVVLVSSSSSIYENLALEEWMYENTDFSDTDYLFMWRNRPAIVFGRHQNPWLEANIPLACVEGVDIARRSSGGGTVYHDDGNINLSFLKCRHRYNRKENLQLVVDSIKSQWDLDLTLNARDDIVLDQFYKVSGTAAKLGRVQSYHHFTLLLGVDTSQLWRLLNSPMLSADSRATKSVPAAVKNLVESAPDMTFELLVNIIGQRFLHETDSQTLQDFRNIDPLNEESFPGVGKVLERLRSWDWIFGKTPKFSLHRTFSGQVIYGAACSLKIDVDIEKGHIMSVSIHLDHQELTNLMAIINLFYSENVRGLKLCRQSVSLLQEKSREHFHTVLGADQPQILSVAKWVVLSVDLCLSFL